jgi:D-aminoacyl-tRNA deacylase
MRAVVQRVTSARVRIGDRVAAAIEHGLLVLVGIARDDTDADVSYMAAKIFDMRVFSGEDDRPNHRSVSDVGGSILLVSQFTLYGDVRRGRRPSFDEAAPPDAARPVYERLVRELRAMHPLVATGEFRAAMRVELINDGPVTVLVDSKRMF